MSRVKFIVIAFLFSGCGFSSYDREGVAAWKLLSVARKSGNEAARYQAAAKYQRVREQVARKFLAHDATLVGEHVVMTFEAKVADGELEVWEKFAEERDLLFEGKSRRVGVVNDIRFPNRKESEHVLFAVRPVPGTAAQATDLHRADARVVRSGQSIEVLEVDLVSVTDRCTIFSTTPPMKLRRGMVGSTYDFVSEFRFGGKRVYEIRVGRANAVGEPRVVMSIDGQERRVGCRVEEDWWVCIANTSSDGFVVIQTELPYEEMGRLP